MEDAKFNPYLAVFFGVIAVSFSSLFVKLSQADAFVIAFYRLFLTFLILLPFAWREKTQELRRIPLRDLFLGVLSGLFLATHFITWFISLRYTSVASSVVLVTTQPIWVVIGSFLLFKEKIGTKAMIGGAIALLGSILIGAADFHFGGRALEGDILALVGAVAISGYLIIGRRLRTRLSLSVYTFLAYGSASLALAGVVVLAGKSFYPYPPREWLLFFSLAVVCTIFGHTVFNWVLKYVQASVVAIGVLGEPVGAIVWASVFLAEHPSPRQIVAASIIIIGLYIFIKFSRTEKIKNADIQ
ncbi:MAG: DMT family transporter [Firmicutes bacterium]|nr:DMT family transporter [Bacillota bacterium]